MSNLLIDALNRKFPDHNYDSLGKNRGWRLEKSYLSYDKTQGWHIVCLNVVQRLRRFLFGSYKSTHLTHVVTHLNRETNLEPQLMERIKTSWNQTYPKLACPLKVNNPSAPLASSTIKNRPRIENQPIEKFIRYEGLPGEWYKMETSQVQQQACNACTSIALFTLSKILENPAAFNPTSFFNDCIIQGSQKHLKQYEKAPTNRTVKQVKDDLNLKNLNIVAEISYDPRLVGVFDDAPQTVQDLTTKAIEQAKGKSFLASLSDGRETIALYYKSPQEIYILDSHQKTFHIENSKAISLGTAYVVKFTHKDDLDKFLFQQRYIYDEEWQDDLDKGYDNGTFNGANQIDLTIFD